MIRLSLLQILLLFLRNALAQTGRLEVQTTTLRHALVEKRGLLSAEVFENFVQEALRFPGIKTVNLSVFFGRLLYGWRGIVVAVCGTVLPSVLGGILAFLLLQWTADSVLWEKFWMGVRAGAFGLLIMPLFQLGKNAKVTWSLLWWPLGVAAMVVLLRFSPFLLVAVTALGSVFLGWTLRRYLGNRE